MIKIHDDVTMVGISELQMHPEKILQEIKKHKVIIGKRNKPVAVLLNMKKYRQMETTLDLLENFALGYLAKDREVRTKKSYVDIKDALKKIKHQ